MRAAGSNAAIALAASLQFLEPPLYSPLGGFIYGILFLGAVLRPAPPAPSKLAYAGLGIIVVSAILVVPLSLFGGNFPSTIILAGLTIGNALYFYAAPDRNFFYYLIPVWVIHAATVLYQWFFLHTDRATGLTAINSNASAAMLLLAAVWFMHSPKLRWLALPMLVALPLTGSRWTALVAVAVVASIFMVRSVSARSWWVPVTLATLAVLVAANLSDILTAFRLNAGQLGGDISFEAGSRFEYDDLLGNIFWPKGFVDSPLHSLPVRMAVETGILSAVAWVALTLWSIKRLSLGAPFWMLITLGLLSVMYYHIWLGPNGAMWWLLVSLAQRVKPDADVIIENPGRT